MKKFTWVIVTALIVIAFWEKSSAGTDVGKLLPVQVVMVSRDEEKVVVQTDTGDFGVGDTLTAAVEDMKASAPGEIFLETAEHLLLAPACMDVLEDAAALLRPSCTLCLVEGEPDMEKLGDFLKLHAPSVTLMEYKAGVRQLQTLKSVEGRMRVVS